MRTHLGQIAWLRRLAATLLALAVVCLASSCNLEDPDANRATDASDSGPSSNDAENSTDTTDASDIADTRSDGDDDASEDTNDSDACQELSVGDFCDEHSVECGTYAGPGLCAEERTEICGGCPGAKACVDNMCTCPALWTGDGIDAAFALGSTVYAMNLGYIWGYSADDFQWTAPQLIAQTSTPVDFTRAPDVSGRAIWDGDGPTAAATVETLTVFFNGSIFWVYDHREEAWTAAGDLYDPDQQTFAQEGGDIEGENFGDGTGTIHAALTDSNKHLILVNRDFFHRFDPHDLSPLQMELDSPSPIHLSNLFSDELFEQSQSRPWDNAMTWGATGRGPDANEPFLILGSGNLSWVGPYRGPLSEEEVSDSSDLYSGAECAQ